MPKNSENDDPAVKFSSNLIGLFAGKVRCHNKDNAKNKVTGKQLKEVFINAAKNYDYAGCTRSQWALARVNTFLRVLEGGRVDSLQRREHTSLGGLVFESSVIKKGQEKEYDISDNWIPSQDDFNSALKDMKENDLEYSFSSVEELYLESCEPVSFLDFNFEL